MVDKNILTQEEIDALLNTISQSMDVETRDLKSDTDIRRQTTCKNHQNKQEGVSPCFGDHTLSRKELMAFKLKVSSIIADTKNTIGAEIFWKVGDLILIEGTPIDVLMNGTLVARGEVALVNDKYYVRVTDIMNKS